MSIDHGCIKENVHHGKVIIDKTVLFKEAGFAEKQKSPLEVEKQIIIDSNIEACVSLECKTDDLNNYSLGVHEKEHTPHSESIIRPILKTNIEDKVQIKNLVYEVKPEPVSLNIETKLNDQQLEPGLQTICKIEQKCDENKPGLTLVTEDEKGSPSSSIQLPKPPLSSGDKPLSEEAFKLTENQKTESKKNCSQEEINLDAVSVNAGPTLSFHTKSTEIEIINHSAVNNLAIDKLCKKNCEFINPNPNQDIVENSDIRNINLDKNLHWNTKLLFDISVSSSSSEIGQYKTKLNFTEGFNYRHSLDTSASSFTGTNTTQVVKTHQTFPYDHETYYTIPTANCHSSFYSSCQVKPLVSYAIRSPLIKDQFRYHSIENIGRGVSVGDSDSKFKSIYTSAATTTLCEKSQVSSEVSYGTDKLSFSSGGQSFLNFTVLDSNSSAVRPSIENKVYSNYGSNLDMGSKNTSHSCSSENRLNTNSASFENKEDNFLSEFPTDRSDGSDSGFGSELVDEKVILKTDSLSSDELDVGAASVLAAPCMSKQLKITKSSLKRPFSESNSGPANKKMKKSINFDSVSIFHFPRTQGFICVPSQGGSTLGMSWTHSHAQKLTLSEHAAEQRRFHRHLVAQLRADNAVQLGNASSSSDSDTDEPTDEEPDANYYFLQPVPTRQRRVMLRAAGVHKIDSVEKDECRDIRTSREFCGCGCKGYCDPVNCACALASIKCQVDRLNFPCGCSRDGCGNPSGRIEFNPVRVRTHFIHTLMRLDLEQKQAQEDQERRHNLQLRNNVESCAGNFSLIPYHESVYGYPHTYNPSGSSAFSYGYNGYVPSYEHPDVADFNPTGFGFQQSPFHFTSPITYHHQVSHNNNYRSGEVKLESFSELFGNQSTESNTVTLNENVAIAAIEGQPQEKTSLSGEESQSENLGDIIKKTIDGSATG